MLTQKLVDLTKNPIALCAAMVGFAVIATASSAMVERPRPSIDLSDIERSIALRFEDGEDGAVRVIDAEAGIEIASIPAGEGGFIRVMMRGLAFKRIQNGGSREEPFLLAESRSGKLILSDPMTGRVVLLDAFGHTNVGAFASLMDHGRENQ